MLLKEIFNKGIEEMIKAFIGFEMTKERANIWYKYSKDLTDSQWKGKIENCIRFCRRIPTLADLLDFKGYYREEKDWSGVKTFEEDDYEYKPIPEEASKIIKKFIPTYRDKKRKE